MFSISSFLSYVFVVSFTPGPNNIMSMANGSNFGYKKTLRFIFGIFTGFFIIMILSCYFNLIIYNLLPRIKTFMSLLGAGYMLYLAIKIMKSKNNIDDVNNEVEKKDTSSFFTGMTMQFVNPKGILYGITIVSNYIIPHFNSNISLILFSFFLAFVAFVSTSCWALFGTLFNKFLSMYSKQFNILMGMLLIYSAITISGITHLFQR